MNENLHDKYERFYKRYGDPTVELHAAYDSWLADQSSRKGAKLVPIEFDLDKYPEQSIYVPKIDALERFQSVPDKLFYPALYVKMSRSLGAFAYRRLLNEFKNQPVSADDSGLLLNRLIENQKQGKNTMVVTSHFTFPELGYFKALRFHAKHDRGNTDKNGVLLSKMMTRQSYGGEKLVDHFKPISNVYFSYPRSANAEKYGVPLSAMNLGNALFKKAIGPDLDGGGLELDAALTGRQVIGIEDENGGIDHYEIPEIHPSSVKLIEDFDDIFGATMILSPITNRWEMQIGDVINIKEVLKTNSSFEIVDTIYSGIAKSIEDMTKKEVVYNKLASSLGKLAVEHP